MWNAALEFTSAVTRRLIMCTHVTAPRFHWLTSYKGRHECTRRPTLFLFIYLFFRNVFRLRSATSCFLSTQNLAAAVSGGSAGLSQELIHSVGLFSAVVTTSRLFLPGGSQSNDCTVAETNFHEVPYGRMLVVRCDPGLICFNQTEEWTRLNSFQARLPATRRKNVFQTKGLRAKSSSASHFASTLNKILTPNHLVSRHVHLS